MAKRERLVQELKVLVSKAKTVYRGIRVPEHIDAEITELKKALSEKGEEATYTEAAIALWELGVQEFKRRLGRKD